MAIVEQPIKHLILLFVFMKPKIVHRIMNAANHSKGTRIIEVLMPSMQTTLDYKDLHLVVAPRVLTIQVNLIRFLAASVSFGGFPQSEIPQGSWPGTFT